MPGHGPAGRRGRRGSMTAVRQGRLFSSLPASSESLPLPASPQGRRATAPSLSRLADGDVTDRLRCRWHAFYHPPGRLLGHSVFSPRPGGPGHGAGPPRAAVQCRLESRLPFGREAATPWAGPRSRHSGRGPQESKSRVRVSLRQELLPGHTVTVPAAPRCAGSLESLTR